MNKNLQTTLIVLAVIVFCGICGVIGFVSMYNQPMTMKIGVETQLGKVAVMQQRQADVVLQAQSGFSQIVGLDNAQILGFVAEAKALKGTLAPYCTKEVCNLPSDPEQLQIVMTQMEKLNAQSNSFIAYVQQHPALRAADAFDTFMINVEGSANRVGEQRLILQGLVGGYKTYCVNIPGQFFCSMRGLTGNEFQFFESAPDAENMPPAVLPTIVLPQP